MTDRISIPAQPERDYLQRTIATVRNHRDADNMWPQWANIFADEIERLWEREAALVEAVEKSAATFDQIAAEAWADAQVPRMRRWAQDASDALRARFDFGEVSDGR